jgi:nucleoside phosphorylase
VEASNATSDLISRYKPDIVVCCGIAGGIKGEVSIGDVIIGDTILYYEPGKVIPGQILPNPTPYRADARLLDRCYNVPKWEGPRFDREGVKEVRPKRKVGVIATGDKTIASEEKLEELRTKLSYQIIGVETEGNGFSAAIWLSPRQVRGIVIRGVSDYAGEDKANPNWAEKQMWQDIASKSAAEFLKHFLYDDPLWEDSTEE